MRIKIYFLLLITTIFAKPQRNKRGLFSASSENTNYGNGQWNYGSNGIDTVDMRAYGGNIDIGGYGEGVYGRVYGEGVYSGSLRNGYGRLNSGGGNDGNIISIEDADTVNHITLQKEIPIRTAVPIPIPIEKRIPVAVPFPVKVDQPIPVHFLKPYPVAIDKPVPYLIEKTVTIPVKIPIKIPFPVKVGIPVVKPIPVKIVRPVPIPMPEIIIFKRPVPVLLDHRASSGVRSIGYGNKFDGINSGIGGHGGSFEGGIISGNNGEHSITIGVNGLSGKFSSDYLGSFESNGILGGNIGSNHIGGFGASAASTRFISSIGSLESSNSIYRHY